MLKKLLLFVTLGLTLSTNAIAQEIIGVKRKVEGGNIAVEALVKDAYQKWLGCTIFPENEETKVLYGNEINLEAKLVTKKYKFQGADYEGENYHLLRFKWQPLNLLKLNLIPLIPGGYSGTVALWNEKVSKRECAKRRGEPCSYCKDQGYHLEGELDRENFEPIRYK